MTRLLLTLAMVTALVAVASPAVAGGVRIDESGADRAAVVEAAAGIARWERGLGARATCGGRVDVAFARLDGRAGEYRLGQDLVVLNPDRPTAGMAYTVVHELSHHTMIACGGHEDPALTVAFYRAQGIPTGRSWFDYSGGWAASPAEQFAEASALAITGTSSGRIPLTAEAVEVVRRWLAGRPLPAIESTPSSDPTALDNPAPAPEGPATRQPAASGEGAVEPEVEEPAGEDRRSPAPAPATADPNVRPAPTDSTSDHHSLTMETGAAGGQVSVPEGGSAPPTSEQRTMLKVHHLRTW